MIRPFEQKDLDRVLDIWLAANLQAHSFLPAAYWEGNWEAVRQALPQAEVYVWEAEREILGFVGLEGDYIAGIFVHPEAQSRGLGRELLDRVKEDREELSLHVYQRNARAAAFYRREGFSALEEGADGATGEKELQMVWRRRR